MNIEKAKQVTIQIFKSKPKIPICWVGGSGIGKTTMAKKIHEELNYDFIYLPLRTEDAMGLNLPNAKRDEVSFVAHERLRRAIKTKALIYIDEFNRMERYTRAAVMELIGERTVGGEPIHKDTIILLTMNDESENYETLEGDKAFKTRIVPIPVETDQEQLIGWANEKKYDKMAAYIQKFPETLNEELTWHLKRPDPRFLEYLQLVYDVNLPNTEHNEIMKFALGEHAAPYMRKKGEKQQIFEEMTIKIEHVASLLDKYLE